MEVIPGQGAPVRVTCATPLRETTGLTVLARRAVRYLQQHAARPAILAPSIASNGPQLVLGLPKEGESLVIDQIEETTCRGFAAVVLYEQVGVPTPSPTVARRLASTGATVIAPNRELLAAARSWIPVRRTRLLPPPAPIDDFVPTKFGPGEPVAIYLGRTAPLSKGVDELCEAWSHSVYPSTGICLRVVSLDFDTGRTGTGIEFVPQAGANRQNYYGESHFYVSMSRWEGEPQAVLEAMSSGLPVILKDIPGHAGLAERNPGCQLVPGPNGLAQAVARIVVNLPERGLAARRFVENHRDPARWARTLGTLL